MSDFKFFHPTEVRYGDLDPQGHVNNAKYLTFFRAGARSLYDPSGFVYSRPVIYEVRRDRGRCAHRFPRAIHFGDDVKVGVRTSKLGNKSMTIEQNIVNNASGQDVAKGEVVT